MNPIDMLSVGLIGVRTRKLRAALSALGISIGIATMVVVTGIPASTQAGLSRDLAALGTNMLQATPAPDQDPPIKLPEESVAMVRRIAPVTAASAVANTHSRVRRNDKLDARDGQGLTVLASKPDLLGVIGARVQDGRWLSPATEKFPGVVLGSVAAERLGVPKLDPRHPAQVIIGDSWFTVVGILATTPLSPDIDRSALVGWPAARSELRFDGHPTVIYIRMHESRVEAVRDVLPATVHPERPGQVIVSRPSDALLAKRATETSYNTLFLGLAGVALLVGAIGVANTMVVSVLERRSEIGLRRALGANRGNIRGQFLTESMTLGGLGGLLGSGIGAAVTAGYATQHHLPIVIPQNVAFAGAAGAVLIGALAGLYPAIRAARLTPTEALATS